VKVDVHQHMWSEPLVDALAARRELPLVRRERGLTVLYLADERPYVIEVAADEFDRRAELVASDGLDLALLCLSSPLGIESLPRRHACALIDAYHEGALARPGPFAAWGAIALRTPEPDDIENVLAAGCLGVSLPAGALAGRDALARLRPLLARLEANGAPLFVHPGPASPAERAAELSLSEPLWWPALTAYVAGMQAAWLNFVSAGRSEHPRLRVIFAMLAGLAPLQHERLLSRGGPPLERDPLIFYETSSYGPAAVDSVAAAVGSEQILYGSARPVVDPGEHGLLETLDWDAAEAGFRRAFAGSAGMVAV
jgi:predicted TIM-barrel fold metal-dependent hydrolase